MSDWAAKRFWDKADVMETENGFAVTLDGRSVKTPAKSPLVVPTRVLADAIAVEWDAQIEKIDPMTMPVTRGANAAIDKVAVQKAEVVDILAAYGDSDLLCYRADQPEELVALQNEAWDPLLEWSASVLGAPLTSAQGVMHVPQDAESLKVLHAHVAEQTAFQLAGFHDLVSMSGSLIIGFAVMKKHLTPDAGWAISRVDEDFQISQWGKDEEASELAAVKQTAFFQAARFYEMSANG